MTINVRIRKAGMTVITESLALAVLKARERGEEINIDIHPDATVFVLEDGATAADFALLTGEPD